MTGCPFVRRVVCLGCGEVSARDELQDRFVALNPGWTAQAGAVAPDGDVFLEDEQVLHFRVPACAACGGVLKPEVTFFGDTVNKATVQLVHERLAEADAVLVAGSSLQVPSVRSPNHLAPLGHSLSNSLPKGVFRLQVSIGSKRQEVADRHPEHRAHEGRPLGGGQSERPLRRGAAPPAALLTAAEVPAASLVFQVEKKNLKLNAAMQRTLLHHTETSGEKAAPATPTSAVAGAAFSSSSDPQATERRSALPQV